MWKVAVQRTSVGQWVHCTYRLEIRKQYQVSVPGDVLVISLGPISTSWDGGTRTGYDKYCHWSVLCQNTMLVKRNATLIHEFFVSSLEEVGLCSKLSPLHQRGHEKFLIQSCVSFDQHCNLKPRESFDTDRYIDPALIPILPYLSGFYTSY